MRPQQNRRMRGRGNNNNNNRRGPNPLTRNYESNGPDVKIRGNAQHIADKYATLSRDAQASGDRVMAENYLQHAEHYMRIILSAQAQAPQPMLRDDGSDDDSDENAVLDMVDNGENEPAGSGPQPVINGTPTEIGLCDNSHMAGAADGEEEDRPRAERPRRVPRRRMPSRTSDKPTDNTTSDDLVAAEKPLPDSPAEKLDNDEAEVVEKPRRTRRVTKAKVAETVESSEV